MSKKDVTPAAVDSNETTNVFDGIKRTASTVIFESKEIKNKLLNVDDESKKKVIADHTLNIEFDFTGLTINECVDQLVSTTSFMKLFQNNIIGNTDKRWTEQTIQETIAKGTYHVTCRELLDNKTRRTADPIAALKRDAKKLKAKGLTNEQIIEQLSNLLVD